MRAAIMRFTPLERYFTIEMVVDLKTIFAIRSMEHLVSLMMQPDSPTEIAETIGMDEEEFQNIIRKANAQIKIPNRSNRSYPLGAASPDKNRRKLA